MRGGGEEGLREDGGARVLEAEVRVFVCVCLCACICVVLLQHLTQSFKIASLAAPRYTRHRGEWEGGRKMYFEWNMGNVNGRIGDEVYLENWQLLAREMKALKEKK